MLFKMLFNSLENNQKLKHCENKMGKDIKLMLTAYSVLCKLIDTFNIYF